MGDEKRIEAKAHRIREVTWRHTKCGAEAEVRTAPALESLVEWLTGVKKCRNGTVAVACSERVTELCTATYASLLAGENVAFVDPICMKNEVTGSKEQLRLLQKDCYVLFVEAEAFESCIETISRERSSIRNVVVIPSLESLGKQISPVSGRSFAIVGWDSIMSLHCESTILDLDVDVDKGLPALHCFSHMDNKIHSFQARECTACLPAIAAKSLAALCKQQGKSGSTSSAIIDTLISHPLNIFLAVHSVLDFVDEIVFGQNASEYPDDSTVCAFLSAPCVDKTPAQTAPVGVLFVVPSYSLFPFDMSITSISNHESGQLLVVPYSHVPYARSNVSPYRFSVERNVVVAIEPISKFGFAESSSSRGALQIGGKEFGQICFQRQDLGSDFYRTGCSGYLSSMDGEEGFLFVSPVSAVDLVVASCESQGSPRDIVLYPLQLEKRILETLGNFIKSASVARGVDTLVIFVEPKDRTQDGAQKLHNILDSFLRTLALGAPFRLTCHLVNPLATDSNKRKRLIRSNVLQFYAPQKVASLNRMLKETSNGGTFELFLESDMSMEMLCEPLHIQLSSRNSQSSSQIRSPSGKKPTSPHIRRFQESQLHQIRTGRFPQIDGDCSPTMLHMLDAEASILKLEQELERSRRVISNLEREKNQLFTENRHLLAERDEFKRKVRVMEGYLTQSESKASHFQAKLSQVESRLSQMRRSGEMSPSSRMYSPNSDHLADLCKLLTCAYREMETLREEQIECKDKSSSQSIQIERLHHRVLELESQNRALKSENNVAVKYLMQFQTRQRGGYISSLDDGENVPINGNDGQDSLFNKASSAISQGNVSPSNTMTPMRRRKALVPFSASKVDPLLLEDVLFEEPELVDTEPSEVDEHVLMLGTLFEEKGIAFPLHKGDQPNEYILKWASPDKEDEILTLGVFNGRLVVERLFDNEELIDEVEVAAKEEEEGTGEFSGTYFKAQKTRRYTDLLQFLATC